MDRMCLIILTFYTFMYYSGCDACEDWYHGDCIGITRKQSKLIKQYFCDVCFYYGMKVYLRNANILFVLFLEM